MWLGLYIVINIDNRVGEVLELRECTTGRDDISPLRCLQIAADTEFVIIHYWVPTSRVVLPTQFPIPLLLHYYCMLLTALCT